MALLARAQLEAQNLERELLEMLSDYLAVAIRNSRLYGEVAETKQHLERLILSAGDAAHRHEALDWLCRHYWRPIYAYLRRRGNDPSSSQDLTQGFFAISRTCSHRSVIAVSGPESRSVGNVAALTLSWLTKSYSAAKS